MRKLKELLVGSLGIVGYVIWNILLYVFYFLPVFVLDFPLWADILIVLCIANLPFLGEILYFVTWIWSFIIIILEPINVFSIFYLVVFGIYVFTDVVPFVRLLITAMFDKKNEEPEEMQILDEETEEMPILDVDALAFATEEEIAQAQRDYANKMAEYVKRNKL